MVKQLFAQDDSICLSQIECDSVTGRFFLLGFMRNKSGVRDYGFAAELLDDELRHLTRLSEKDYANLRVYCELALAGFTKKVRDLWRFEHFEYPTPISIADFVKYNNKEDSP